MILPLVASRAASKHAYISAWTLLTLIALLAAGCVSPNQHTTSQPDVESPVAPPEITSRSANAPSTTNMEELAPDWGKGSHWRSVAPRTDEEPLLRAEISVDPIAEPFWEFWVLVFEERTICVRQLRESYFDLERPEIMYAVGPQLSEPTKAEIGQAMNQGTFPYKCPVDVSHCPQPLVNISFAENWNRDGGRGAFISYGGYDDSDRFVNWVETTIEAGCDPNVHF